MSEQQAGPGAAKAPALWQGLAVSAVTLVLALAVLEVVVRLYVPRPPRWHEPQVRARSSPTLQWELRPHQRAYTIDSRVVTNAAGFRAATDSEPGTGSIRILAMGDSITFGHGVPFEAVYARQVERLLDERYPGRRVEVINMGVPGYNIRQHLIALKEKGVRYRPHLVILGFCWNDIIGNEKPLPGEPGFVPERPVEDADDDLKWRPQHVIPKSLRDPLRDWRTLYVTVQRVKVLKERLVPSNHPYIVHYRALLSKDEARLGPAWAATERRLRELADLTRAHGIDLVVVIFPDGAQLVDRYRSIPYQERVKAMAARADVPVVDLLPEFMRAVAEGRRLFLDSSIGHPSIEGHALAAREIVRFIVHNGPGTRLAQSAVAETR